MAFRSISSVGEVTVRTLGYRHLAWRMWHDVTRSESVFREPVDKRLAGHLRTEYTRRFHGETSANNRRGFYLQLGGGGLRNFVFFVSWRIKPPSQFPVTWYLHNLWATAPSVAYGLFVSIFPRLVSTSFGTWNSAIRAAQISRRSNRVPDVRGSPHPLWGQRDAHESGASFSQELPVVKHLYKT